MGDDVRYTVDEVIIRTERALRDLRNGYSLEAVKLAVHPDVDMLYALCVKKYGLPRSQGETGTELMLSHVAGQVPDLISDVVLAKGVHSSNPREMSCPEFCKFVAADAAQHREESDRQPTGTGEAAKPTHMHSSDFRSVHWFGSDYTFTANQSRALKLLYENWKNGTPDVGDETLLSAVDHIAPPERLNVLFREHPAWGTMIVQGRTKGTHRLVEPSK